MKRYISALIFGALCGVMYAQSSGVAPGWQPIDAINTEYQEFSPTISPDGSFMVFDSSRPGGLGDKDLWISYYRNGQWSAPENLRVCNSAYHDQEPFLTYDGRALLFTSDRPGGFGVGDIYISYRVGNSWSAPVNLGAPINTADSEKMPSLSMDGRELYFARIPLDRAAQQLNIRAIQIYCAINQNGTWQTPTKLPAPVNQMTMDYAPRIMPDGRTLLFASLRDGGMGRLDIWRVKRAGFGSPWTSLSNLSSINTENNEVYFSFNINGDRLYMSLQQLNSDNYDIYEFNVTQQISDPTITLNGTITNITNGMPVRADIIIESFSDTNALPIRVASDPHSGAYSVTLPRGGDYSLTVETPGYMFYNNRYDLTALSNSSVTNIDIGLHPLVVGQNIVINNIFFDPDDYSLREESRLALDRLAALMNENPRLKILIKGHTAEGVGGRMDSQRLSELRARSVKQYLVDKGIEPGRLETRGYGGTQPIGDNRTEAGRRQNRRTEFEITAQ